ncbi:alpha/beta hydrolase [uncultured Castellaniella sp.]|uniref:alpha/beta fold hydrolase n=1 Tax=uncultured Castellaniella sp. TaxID=647907 RepID=UPI002602D1D4|nr:alpha/beta hydrolase [uncultured Castellaniella sp.]
MNAPRSYLLVHGAWHGGWCWSAVAKRLRQAGHDVHAPTLPGLGERRHLLGPDITLETFIQDVAQRLIEQDLREVILVGHSFGGLVISGVADRLPERIRRLVYLDAFLLPPGKSTFDTLPEAIVQRLEQSAAGTGGIAPPKPESLGLSSPADIAHVRERLTPHPIGTYREPLHLDHPLGNGLPATCLRCVRPPFPAVAQAYDWARATQGDRWDWRDLECGHDAMISAPDQVAEALLDVAAASR